MGTQGALAPLVRRFYRQFYNRFAFTYDPVSAIVSRGEWHAWTRAAIPFVRDAAPTSGRAPRVLEIAFGTGNLLLDLTDAGYTPIGVDLSPNMIEIALRKLRKRRISLSILRSAVRQLPFPTGHFDSIVMTFPPGFVTDPFAMQEIQRVLADHGRLIWVDAPHLYPRNAWSRFLNWAYRITSGAPPPSASKMLKRSGQANRGEVAASPIDDWLPLDGWTWQIERIERRASYVHVIIGSKLVRPSQ